MIKGARILIVDDNKSLSRSLSFVLESKDCVVVTASDGLEALNSVKNKSFDVIFMDIKMPGLNGVDTFKKVKKISPTTVVVMMTAYAVDVLVKEALIEGAYGILYKPLDMEKVFEVIESTREWNQKQGEGN